MRVLKLSRTKPAGLLSWTRALLPQPHALRHQWMQLPLKFKGGCEGTSSGSVHPPLLTLPLLPPPLLLLL